MAKHVHGDGHDFRCIVLKRARGHCGGQFGSTAVLPSTRGFKAALTVNDGLPIVPTAAIVP
jgi:hypothetical protein